MSYHVKKIFIYFAQESYDSPEDRVSIFLVPRTGGRKFCSTSDILCMCFLSVKTFLYLSIHFSFKLFFFSCLSLGLSFHSLPLSLSLSLSLSLFLASYIYIYIYITVTINSFTYLFFNLIAFVSLFLSLYQVSNFYYISSTYLIFIALCVCKIKTKIIKSKKKVISFLAQKSTTTFY